MTEKKRPEAFLASVSHDGDVTAEKIREEADRERESALLSLAAEVAKETERAEKRAAERAEKSAAARLAAADAEIRATVSAQREREADLVITRARELLGGFRKTDAYREYMIGAARRIAEAISGEEDAAILIGEEDAGLCSAMAEVSGGVPVTVSDALTGGGVGDSRGVRCDLSFETALLEQREETVRILAEEEAEKI